MLGVFLTIWLLVQLPVAMVLARLLACPQRNRAEKRGEARYHRIAPRARAA